MKHYPVLSKEVIEKLGIKENGIYVDCTLGLGGHTKLIAELAIKGKVISFDQDEQALNQAKENLKKFKNITFVLDNFNNLKNQLNKLNLKNVDGVIFDLGTSYYQLTDENRGFTYHGQSKLDMRMNTEQTKTAIDVLNEYSELELRDILYKYGDEPKAPQIASAIVKYRQTKKIVLNTQLNEIIKSVKGFNKDKHPSKNIFQAIRIEVNNEIENIKKAIEQATNLLNLNGKVLVITFHSLEDKVVKNIFWNKKQLVDISLKGNTHYFKTSKTIYPSKEEIEKNNASRSAKLRILTKIN